MKLIPILQ
jgi:hypothetical protein